MNRQMLGLLGAFLFFVLFFAPAWAEDMVWSPRTPAGGGYIDPDYYMKMAEVVQNGSFVQVQEHVTFQPKEIGYGSAEWDDTGRLIFYDAKGERVDLDNFGEYSDDPDRPNGVKYSSPSKTVITIK